MSKSYKQLSHVSMLVLVIVMFVVSCSGSPGIELPITMQPSPVVSPTMVITTPTSEPPAPPTLVICLRQEPESLYLYAPSSRETEAILSAIYDGPYDIRSFQAQPVILERMPDLTDGDARIERVSVSEGDLYLDPQAMQPIRLESGMRYLPPECQNQDCMQIYWGGEVWMEQMVVDFQLRDDIRWSDGEPLTASDSVFSFQLDANIDTPSTKYLIDRTSSYETIDHLTVRWTGIPGYFDSEYPTLFWSPLPEHVLDAYSPSEIMETEIASRMPLGWGAYQIESWTPGEQILLRKNPEYYRASEGLPKFEYLIYRFLGDAEPQSALQQVLTYECDVVDESLMLPELTSEIQELEGTGRMNMAWVPGSVLERLEFNLYPTTRNQQPILANLLVRDALARCIDRQRIVEDVLLGLSQTSETYLPVLHPLYAIPEAPLAYDPVGAMAELERLGWTDEDDSPDTPRVARGVADVQYGTPLLLNYVAVPGEFQEAVALRVQEDLQQCGVQVEVEILDSQDLFVPWPEGQVFGRTFGLLNWAWPSLLSPACEMFLSSEIPSDDRPFGINASGFRDSDYDLACKRILLGAPYGQEYAAAVQETQRIFSSHLPAIPLYVRPRIVAFAPEVCGIEVDPSTFSVLWNLETYASGDQCVP
ncbi:MAG: ABC transporter substrate-binding protein [Anaerolineales bacterium]